MKKSITLLSMVLLLLTTQRCAEDQTPTKPGRVQFALRASSKNADVGRRGATITNANTVFVTIRKSSGEELFTRKQITLLNLGGNLVSEPLVLEPGDYEITEFMLAELGYIITFATPMEGSALAEFVDDPLPIPFTVTEGAATDLDIEVIDATREIPEAFGYVTFGVTQAPQPIFQLAVFAPLDGELALTKSHLYIIEGGDTIVNRDLDATINMISFVQKNDVIYNMIITANSYKTFSRSFATNNLDFLYGEPWMVTLEPALTMVTPFIPGPFPYNYSFRMGLHADITTGTIHVAWGANHNAISVYTLDQVKNGPLTQSINGERLISVTRNIGDVDAIQTLEINGNTRDIGLKHLSRLQTFSMTSVVSPDTIDFSRNLRLYQIDLSNTTIRGFRLPANDLRYLTLTGATNLSTETVDKIIDDMYQRSISTGQWGGQLSIGVTTAPNSPLIGPPSAASIQKLRIMRGAGWVIYPQIF